MQRKRSLSSWPVHRTLARLTAALQQFLKASSPRVTWGFTLASRPRAHECSLAEEREGLSSLKAARHRPCQGSGPFRQSSSERKRCRREMSLEHTRQRLHLTAVKHRSLTCDGSHCSVNSFSGCHQAKDAMLLGLLHDPFLPP